MGWLLGLFKPLGSRIASFFLEYFFNKIITAIKDWSKKKEEDKKNQEAVTEYLEKVNNPNLTREERREAEDKYLNS